MASDYLIANRSSVFHSRVGWYQTQKFLHDIDLELKHLILTWNIFHLLPNHGIQTNDH